MIAVRQAAAADVPTLVDLMAEVYGESSVPLDRAWAAQSFRDLRRNPSHGPVWLLEVDGSPGGHVVLSVRSAMEFGGVLGYIDDLFVKQDYRRRGDRAVPQLGLGPGVDERLQLTAVLPRQRGCN